MKLVLLTALGVGGATLLGTIIGFIFKKISHRFSDIVLSFAAGIMLAAAVLGLILPSLDYGGQYGILITVAGIFAGAVCINVLDKAVPHLHKLAGADIEAHPNNQNVSKVLLFITAIAIHNLPEGIAAGVSFGTDDPSSAILIAGGIGVSLPMIETILGIIILSVQVILILWKLGKKIYEAIKKKKYGEVEAALNEAKGELENLKEKTDGKD